MGETVKTYEQALESVIQYCSKFTNDGIDDEWTHAADALVFLLANVYGKTFNRVIADISKMS